MANHTRKPTKGTRDIALQMTRTRTDLRERQMSVSAQNTRNRTRMGNRPIKSTMLSRA